MLVSGLLVGLLLVPFAASQANTTQLASNGSITITGATAVGGGNGATTTTPSEPATMTSTTTTSPFVAGFSVFACLNTAGASFSTTINCLLSGYFVSMPSCSKCKAMMIADGISESKVNKFLTCAGSMCAK